MGDCGKTRGLLDQFQSGKKLPKKDNLVIGRGCIVEECNVSVGIYNIM